jgi:hypothetical protein
MPQQATRQTMPGKSAGSTPLPLASLSTPSASSQAFTLPTGVTKVPCAGCWIQNAAYNLDGTQNKDVVAILANTNPAPGAGYVAAPTIGANPGQVLITIAPGVELFVDTDDATKLTAQRVTTLGTRSDVYCSPLRGGQ